MDIKSPYKDFKGNEIYSGCVLVHPSGQEGVIVFHPERLDIADQWVIQYNDEFESRLCLQVGEKGRAVIKNQQTKEE